MIESEAKILLSSIHGAEKNFYAEYSANHTSFSAIGFSPKPGYLVFCSHPPIVTLGRATQSGDVFAWSGQSITVSRSGRATYHGPSQLVIYPVVNLKLARKGRAPQEVQGFLRDLEDAIVVVLKSYGIEATGRTRQKKFNSEAAQEETGVWGECC